MRGWWLKVMLAIAIGLLVSIAVPHSSAAQGEVDGDGRPILPEAQAYPTTHFLIHYTLVGASAVPATDADISGTSDFVEFVGSALEDAYTIQITEMGWAVPPIDGMIGGDDRIDVYLGDLLSIGVAGLVAPDGGFVGDNPLTDAPERNASFVFMVLDNDFAEAGSSDAEQLTYARSTIMHEFNHVLQSGYDALDPHFWMYEAGATWMEYQIMGEASGTPGYLPLIVQNTDLCLPAHSSRAGEGLRWYASWLFLRYLSEQFGPEVVRSVWENMRLQDAYEAIDTALAPYDTSLEQEMIGFAVHNLLRQYDNGMDYPPLRLEGVTSAAERSFTPSDGVQSFGADVIRIDGDRPVDVRVRDFEVPLTVVAVGVRQADGASVADLYALSGDQPLVIDLARYEQAYLIVQNNERAVSEDACTFAPYTVEVSQTQAEPSALLETLEAPYYTLPLEGAFRFEQPDGPPPDEPFVSADGKYAAEPDGIDLPYTLLIPLDLPDGYTFDLASIRDPGEFGQLEEYYAPGSEPAASFDYTSADGAYWIGVVQSPGPYQTLAEWLDDIDYQTPGEIQMVDGVDVLVEDLTRGGETWISATLIVDHTFIVVDGSEGQAPVLEMVREIIRVARPPASAPRFPTPVPAPVYPPGLSPGPYPPGLPPELRAQPARPADAMASFVVVLAGMCVFSTVMLGVMALLILVVGVGFRGRD
ncbi:MAG: hypothetical protein IT326_08270 [Anaerolineae bacterium]|nr:hypothetical protein [Anaerolineae bacterium]